MLSSISVIGEDDNFVQFTRERWYVAADKSVEIEFSFKVNSDELLDEINSDHVISVYRDGVEQDIYWEHTGEWFSYEETASIELYCPEEVASGTEYTLVVKVASYTDTCKVIVRNHFEFRWTNAYIYNIEWDEFYIQENKAISIGNELNIFNADFSPVDDGYTTGIYFLPESPDFFYLYKEDFTDTDMPSGVYRLGVILNHKNYDLNLTVYFTVVYNKELETCYLDTGEVFVDLSKNVVRAPFYNMSTCNLNIIQGDYGGYQHYIYPGNSKWPNSGDADDAQYWISCMYMICEDGEQEECTLRMIDYDGRTDFITFQEDWINLIPSWVESIDQLFEWLSDGKGTRNYELHDE